MCHAAWEQLYVLILGQLKDAYAGLDALAAAKIKAVTFWLAPDHHTIINAGWWHHALIYLEMLSGKK